MWGILTWLLVGDFQVAIGVKAETSNQPIFEVGILAGNGNAFDAY